ncbi:MAG: serine hydrolase domain-containing protein, partial [Flammeovirgaceae bacterium]
VGSPCNENTPECAAGKMCEAFLDSTGLNGLQLAVGRHGSIWRKSFGLSDAAAQVQVNDSTKFRIGSISKSMTSMALVKLFLGGKLDLDVSIQKYLPQFPKKKYGFTARQLAGHLAGFRDYTGIADYVHHEHYESALQALRVFEHDTLLFKPGSKFYYSTFGWSVLGAVIESICGKNYLTVMNESVFKPLGLKNTRGDNSKEKIFNRAKFYDEDGQENEFGDVSYKYAGGGLLSTSTDLVKFGYSMLRQGDTVKDILFTSQRTADGVATGYGFGWYVGIDKNGHRYWHHSGDGFSSSSHLLIYPDDDLVIAFLANGQQGAAFDIEALASYFLRK